jgi:hypothetical protein
MPHVAFTEELPDIRSLFTFRPEPAKPLCDLARVLYNWYVDGLAAWAPPEIPGYRWWLPKRQGHGR